MPYQVTSIRDNCKLYLAICSSPLATDLAGMVVTWVNIQLLMEMSFWKLFADILCGRLLEKMASPVARCPTAGGSHTSSFKSMCSKTNTAKDDLYHHILWIRIFHRFTTMWVVAVYCSLFPHQPTCLQKVYSKKGLKLCTDFVIRR